MDLENSLSRNRDFDDKFHPDFYECDEPECDKHDSPFAPNYSCGTDSESESPSNEEHLESSSHGDYCRSYKDFCMPIIFDRRFDYSHREICSRNFSLRLGGLRNRMASALRQYLGCKVKIGYECDNEVKSLQGRISFVGSDFVEMKKVEFINVNESKNHKGHHKKDYFMIPFDTINWLELEKGKRNVL